MGAATGGEDRGGDGVELVAASFNDRQQPCERASITGNGTAQKRGRTVLIVDCHRCRPCSSGGWLCRGVRIAAQLTLEDLALRVLRQCVDDLHVLGHLMRGELLFAERTELVDLE